MLPPLKSLVAFEACARHNSITKAAEELHVTQAAISQHIKALEHYLGFPLFNREKRRLKLSIQGLQYYPTVHQSLRAISTQTKALTHRNEPQLLSVKVNTSFAYHWLIPILDDFYQQHPYIRIKLYSEDWPQLEATQTNVDIEIVNGQPNPEQHTELLCKEYWIAVCSPDFKKKHNEAIQAGTFEKLPGIYVRGYAEGWHEWMASSAHNSSPPVQHYEVDSTLMGLELAAQSAGLMLCRSLNAIPQLKSGRIIMINNHLIASTDSHYLQYDKNNAPPKVNLFTAWLRQKLLTLRPDEQFFSAIPELSEQQVS
ncbi:LysR substrate-binding domain-containing protein [Photobacterium makurazakiensis]|uniref:LysR substrate-binding domain-containing protein n=1 Tax=Photobacterium makurazakiensis TaxID=2910234 RepID=UPI003D0F6B4E